MHMAHTYPFTTGPPQFNENNYNNENFSVFCFYVVCIYVIYIPRFKYGNANKASIYLSYSPCW